MSTRPGYAFSFTANPPNQTDPTNTGVAFIATTATQGRSDKAVLCHNMNDIVMNFGPRSSGALLYDIADVAFRSGLQSMWVGRRVGPAAAKATVTPTGSGLAIDSIGAGPSTLEVQIVAGAVAGSVQLVITDNATGLVVETSPSLSATADLAAWANTKSNYIAARVTSTTLPTVSATQFPLAGGVTDNANVADTTLDADLTRLFPATLGCGQLLVPGDTTTAAHVSMLNHCVNNNRFALMDGADSSDPSVAVAAVQAIQVATALLPLGETWGMLIAPWRVVPGVTALTTRTVPGSAVVAGLIAASDAAGDANQPAAGANGIDGYSISSSQVEWSDANRTTLNNAGVVVFHLIGDGTQRVYGWRTTAVNNGTDDASAAWVSAGAARLRMQMVADLSQVAEGYMFQQIDGNGQVISAFTGDITGVLSDYWARGALYGDVASDAFSVDCGSTVNTPVTLGNNELHANIGIKVSPFAEMIYFAINKAALTAASV